MSAEPRPIPPDGSLQSSAQVETGIAASIMLASHFLENSAPIELPGSESVKVHSTDGKPCRRNVDDTRQRIRFHGTDACELFDAER
ncbi:hypothetical protein [Burkholderia pyrrocinia]|uniref:hypothetical protein n=1 Tax=Burkholderia pyrrocinia TaxID=60550 RepID=UPI0037D76735